MVRLAPFRALRYDAGVAGPDVETSAPAYDELDRFSYTSHRTTNPYTVLELLTGDHTAGGDPFVSARATLERWQRTGVLVTDPDPAMYLYEQHELRHGVPAVQRGVIGALDLHDLDDGALLPHEHIDPQRAARRAARLAAVPLDLTPAVAIHAGGVGPDLPSVLQMARVRAPLMAFTDEMSIDHRVWRISDPPTLSRLRAAYTGVTAVLADGHHRVEAARRLRDRPGAAGHAAGWGSTTVWLVDATADGPELRAVHRLLRARPPMGPDDRPELPGFHALPWSGGVPALEHSLTATPGVAFGLVTAGGSWLLRADDPDAVRAEAADAAGPLLGVLDAQVLAASILPRFGDPGVEAVFDVEPAVAALRHDDHMCLVLVRPPQVEQVMTIAAAGERMPAKTTWFRPKPRAGLIMRRLDQEDGTTAPVG